MCSRDGDNANLAEFRASLNGQIQKQPVEHAPRKDRDRLVERKVHAASTRADNFTLRYPVSFNLSISQERILRDGLVGYAATTRFLPGHLFVQEKHAVSSSRQSRCCQRAGRTGTNYCDSGASHLCASLIMSFVRCYVMINGNYRCSKWW